MSNAAEGEADEATKMNSGKAISSVEMSQATTQNITDSTDDSLKMLKISRPEDFAEGSASFETGPEWDATETSSVILANALIFTGNEYLDNEITDLSEYFAVQTESSASDIYWIRLLLPLCLRRIQEGQETINSEKFLLSFQVKLSDKEAEEVEAEGEAEAEDKHNVEIEANDSDNVGCGKEGSVDCGAQSAVVQNPSDGELNYKITNFSISERPEWLDQAFEDKLNELLARLIGAKDMETTTSDCKDIASSLLGVIEEFYEELEIVNYPFKEVIERDFYFPIFDPRHWCRSNYSTTQSSMSSSTANSFSNFGESGNNSSYPLNVSYRARALYDFQALMQGELSFQENDLLQVFANLGNGWLTARKLESSEVTSSIAAGTFSSSAANSPTSILSSSDDSVGLIPENYIERLS